MRRLVIGNNPSGNLSLVALKETAELVTNRIDFSAAYQIIKFDSNVDNLFVIASNIRELRAKIEEIENASAMGGFHYKEWIISGEDISAQLIGTSIEMDTSDEENTFRIYWDVRKDEFYVKSNFDKQSKRGRQKNLIVISTDEEIRILEVKQHLTLRICLSLHAMSYDPLGFVLPTRMIGQLLFRESLQDLKKKRKGKIPWDEPISSNFL